MYVNILRIYSQNSHNNVIYIVNRSTGDSYRTYMPIYVYDIDKRMRKESYLYAKLHTQTKLQQRLQSSVLAWDIPCTNKSFLNTLSINHSGITRNHFNADDVIVHIKTECFKFKIVPAIQFCILFTEPQGGVAEF